MAVSAVCTGLGWYAKLGKHAGAGTLVPITGFANGVVSSAIEARTEGWILGIGTRIFAIAGPVILYGTTASMVYGLIYYFWTLFRRIRLISGGLHSRGLPMPPETYIFVPSFSYSPLS